MTASALTLFLAHAVALETEAGERYEELADVMEVHNNPEVAALFRQMSEFSRLHASQVGARAAAHAPLPRLKSWEYRWDAPEPPESGDAGDTHYLMTPYHALRFALANERSGWEYYNRVATDSPDPEVRAMASEFATEEAEHVATLERWLDRAPRPDADWAEDADPVQVVD
jgi:rubrerythrin